MPYIKPEDRDLFNEQIEILQGLLLIFGSFSPEKFSGAVNYIISRIVAGSMKPRDGWNYESLSKAIKTLRDAANEMQRRLLDPYENKCITKNGDLPEYEKEIEHNPPINLDSFI